MQWLREVKTKLGHFRAKAADGGIPDAADKVFQLAQAGVGRLSLAGGDPKKNTFQLKLEVRAAIAPSLYAPRTPCVLLAD